MKKLSSNISKNGQHVNMVYVCEVKGRKVRVRIQSDSYDFQSYARAEVWDGNKWNEVATRPYSQMDTPYGLCYAPHDGWKDEGIFLADFNYLIREVELVL